MSILSQFFQNRHTKTTHKEQDTKNQAIVSIFNKPFQTPKTKVIAKNKIIKKQQKLELQDEDIQQNIDEDEQKQKQQKIKKSKKQRKNKSVDSQIVDEKKQKKIKKSKKNQNKEQNTVQINKQKLENENQAQNQSQPKAKLEQPENLDSTVFVGNVPLSSTHKSIKKHFDKYGKVLKVWFRSIPVQQSKIPKKGLHILKKYQEGADSMNAYVKFQKQSEAKGACSANGSDIEGKNIKVTLYYQTTIFIGNLPRKIKDQQLWDAFKAVGTVKSVRVIRNKDTHEGIGIGYVRFETQQEMKKAIKQMNGKNIGDRPMRIKKAVTKERLQKKVRKIKQKKQLKFKKSNGQQSKQEETTGKGNKIRQRNEKQSSNNSFRNNDYPNKKNKKIAKPQKFRHEEKPQFNNNKRNYNTPQNAPSQQQSNQIIRSKFGFHGTKKMLE